MGFRPMIKARAGAALSRPGEHLGHAQELREMAELQELGERVDAATERIRERMDADSQAAWIRRPSISMLR